MATLQLPADLTHLALRQAGADVLACLANAQAQVLTYSFAGRKRDRAAESVFGPSAAQTRRITFIALQADVDASPIELVAEAQLDVDGTTYRIAERSNDMQVGQTTLVLEALA